MKILFVEDNEDSRLILQKQLQYHGHQVELAATGLIGLDVARACQPDLIISDILMPDMDGYKFLEEVRADQLLKNTPFVFYTATFVDSRDEKLAMELGADRYLHKPIEITELLKVLDQVFVKYAPNGSGLAREKSDPKAVSSLYQEVIGKKLGEKAVEVNLYKEIFANAIDAIAVVDLQGHYIVQNESHRRLFGVDDQQLGGLTPATNLGDECFQLILDTIQRLGKYEGEAECQVGEKIIYLELSAFPIKDCEGQITSYVEVKRDITRRRQAEKEREELHSQLVQSQKMEVVGRLAGGIAHDFNNLLNAILGYSELALLDMEPDNPLRKTFDYVREAGEKAARLVKQLLAFSRKQVFEMNLVNANFVLEGLENILRRLIGEDVELHLELCLDINLIWADPGQLEQVLMNLVINGRDAMPEGGVITISTQNIKLAADNSEGLEPGSYVLCRVKDSGSGMEPEIMADIFEPYFTTKEEGKGTGLGLATVFGIVKQHNGQIKVESQPGQGSTFSVYFPESMEKENTCTSLAKGSYMEPGHETILLVEDDTAFRNLLVLMLQPMGYKVLAAVDGADAIRIFEESHIQIDLLLTDVILPKLNGVKVASLIREKSPGTRVIYISGYTDDIIAPLGVRGKGQIFLQKPFSAIELTRKIRLALGEQKGEG